ncbi:glucoamylase [Motilibacter peucedani]|uniref:Glucoamylase n=1 Tax=Motilibacter peucedani TaxID=598650 RepID=A0A420XVW2_9ACTN|nr:glycoside hydrolase family 15 protein [Motilibacter peucedani]RKS84314.1 glucoamylase [Motilibacter peucedani]
MSRVHPFTAVLAVVGLLTTPALLAAPASAGASGAAPGGPGAATDYLAADKSGFATSTTAASTVWLTVQKEGGLGEVFYPDLGTPGARALRFLVSDGGSTALAQEVADVRTTVTDQRSLSYRQTFVQRAGHWRLTADYATDPARATVLVHLRLAATDGKRHAVYVAYEPTLTNDGTDDSGATRDGGLVAHDATTASALVAATGFTATSTGYRGTSDGITDLTADGRLDGRWTSAGPGSIVQTAATSLTGWHDGRETTLALAFGSTTEKAVSAARSSLATGYAATSHAYAAGWHAYLRSLKTPPSSLDSGAEKRLYRASVMVLAASEDKTHRGAYVASPTMPWRWGKEKPSGPYHLVWSRDLYQIASSLALAGDVAGANRALDYLFDVQQKPDGSFPQNSAVDGTPVWGGLQLDEVAFPMVLAYQLGRTDEGTWAHVKAAADFLVGFSQDGNVAPWTPQDRWENQSGYSPATIAAEIAGLVCAASIARANGDAASAGRYLAAADSWRAHLKAWTVTTTGPYSSGPYFLRLTKDGMPNAGTTYAIGDSGPSAMDQRRVVDPSFLDVVRLGVLPASDPSVVNSLRVVDEQLGVSTARGVYWHRASFDGYGERRDGSPWDFGLPEDSRLTLGRAWPLLNGERGEYDLAAGDRAAASAQITTMARAAGPGRMLPEQVWDDQAPAGTDGFVPGTPTFSATPLAWTHAQFVRLAWDVRAGRVLEQPAVVAQRYAG